MVNKGSGVNLTQPLRPPTAGNNAVPPQMLGLKEYLSAREEEIYKVFGRRSAAGSVQFPVRSLRRRIRSTRPRGRLTARQIARLVDRKGEKGSSDPKKPLSRKAKRRKLAYWENKSVLCNHRWHAKRYYEGHQGEGFRMMNGIPMKVRDKGERAIYRLASRRCVILDRSFWPCIRVGCDTAEDLEDVLGNGLRTSPSITEGMFAPENHLRSAALLLGKDAEVISPIYCLREGDPATQALLWVHPSALERTVCELDGKACRLHELSPTEVSWFALRGPTANEVVSKTLGDRPPSSLGAVRSSKDCRLITTSQGCDVVVSSSAPEVFRRLVFGGASAIGLEDWERLNLGVPCFPMDYPESAVCRRRSAQLAKTALEGQTRRPRTLKGDSLALESPLFTDWSLLTDAEGLELPAVDRGGSLVTAANLVCVRLTSAGRGIPENLAHIYEMDGTDKGESALYQPKGAPGSIRKLVGFVTSGGFSYSLRRGAAIAFIKVCSPVPNRVWYRNITSRNYHIATVEKVHRWEGADSFLSGLNAVST
ncbi:hypothetical protein FOL47_002210 [Perkinsus chesapeaki]|uniref:Uncharacterized protein n=1 Tax=Perkinsus chesapeaki TaxID=330153 RepID=A0A7J6MES6_PERCH|nr:hypothetical protein FOL47_002210 [Perkinsus chesapeaki]